MVGDILKLRVSELSFASKKKVGDDAFWVILREIAKDEIINYGGKIDSDEIIPIYYEILLDNLDCIPYYFQEKLPSNKQERFRVIIRNMFSSNAFHPDGLANQDGIYAYKEVNESKKGERIVFQKERG